MWEPLGFFSRHLTQAQIKYSAFDKELYAAFAAIKHFRHSLECARFQLRTDHKPLQMALRRVGDPWSPRQCRQLAWISEFTEDVVYLPGPKNVVADALSRQTAMPAVPVSAVKVPVLTADGPSIDELADGQHGCVEVKQLLRSTALVIESVKTPLGKDLWIDISTGHSRVLVPVDLRQRVMAGMHGIHHPGARGTLRLVSRAFVWGRMRADVKEYVRSCTSCDRAKVQ